MGKLGSHTKRKSPESDTQPIRYGTKEFEVTTDRLGCYRPEEHIDNPKDYADNIDARQYDRRLRGPVDERRELSINPQTGKSYNRPSSGKDFSLNASVWCTLYQFYGANLAFQV